LEERLTAWLGALIELSLLIEGPVYRRRSATSRAEARSPSSQVSTSDMLDLTSMRI
jgi:hypothetical protein